MSRKIGVTLSYILMIFEVLSTLLLTPFILRTLGQAEYGVYKLSVAINAYLLLLDLGIGNAVTRYVAKYRVDNNEILGRRFLGVATIFYVIVAIIAIIFGLIIVAVFPDVFAKGLRPDEIILGQKLLIITMINSAVTLGTSAYTNVMIAYERFAVSKGLSIIQIILRMSFIIVALKLGYGAIGIVTVNLILTIIFRGFFVIYVICSIKLIPMFKGIEGSFIKDVFSYSSLILLQMIATQINASVDQLLIGAIVSSSSTIIAVYGVGTQIVQYFQSMGSAFTGVLMPGIVKIVENGSSSRVLTDEMIKIGRIIFMVLALIWGGFLVNGKQFVILWAGEVNSQSFIVSIILMTAYTFTLTQSVGSQILWAMNEHKEQAILKIIIVLVNIILTFFLIKWDPLIGATIGTFISIMIGDVLVMNAIFIKKIKINLKYYYAGLIRGIVPSLVVTLIIGFIARRFITDGWIGLIINIIIMSLSYVIMMYLYGMNEYEKRLAYSMLHSIKRKSRC